MPITVLSPHSGRPVKIRDQDIQRAVRDDENRIFYVLQDENGEYYSAMTRQGGEKDLERYRKLQGSTDFQAAQVKEQTVATLDRTGKSKIGRKIFVYLIILALGVISALLAYQLGYLGGSPSQDETAPIPHEMQMP